MGPDHIKIILEISPRKIGKLYDIAEQGLASNGHWQDVEYVINKALDEFIKKYHPNSEK